MSFGSVFPVSYAAMGNLTLLGPTRTPWPFPEMLAHGLIGSVFVMSLVGLLLRLLQVRRQKRVLSVASSHVRWRGYVPT